MEKPLLYKNRKFDIRCYAMTMTVNGNFQGYWYTDGYLRTCSREYNTKNEKNRLIHLTNDAVQKKSDDYGKFESGNKVSPVTAACRTCLYAARHAPVPLMSPSGAPGAASPIARSITLKNGNCRANSNLTPNDVGPRVSFAEPHALHAART